jgi:hypothetical protein
VGVAYPIIRAQRSIEKTLFAFALGKGLRGLPPSSLHRLLSEHRGAPYRWKTSRLTVRQVLAWARAYRRRTGTWPAQRSGPIPEAPGETWQGIDGALRHGRRGLPGGEGLGLILHRRLGARTQTSLPPLTVEQILGWADRHRQKTGRWPTVDDGKVVGAGGETWRGINHALARGYRGLPGGSSLAQLLAQRRGKRNKAGLPRLTVKQILGWADKHHERTGQWPNQYAGPVADAPGEDWRDINGCLQRGFRGLPGRDSLARLLERCRRVRRWARQA